MPYEDVPAFYAKLQNEPETVGRLALMFTMLAAARSGETRGATRAEIDLDAHLWSIPGSRMKAGKDHVVPLNDAAMAILERAALPKAEHEKPVFPGKSGKPISDMTMSKIIRDMKLPFTVHGMRSSLKDWAVECTSFPDAVSEAALAHVDANRVRAAYRRTDFLKMRAELMAIWGRHVIEGRTCR